jgi:hypothetical protein
MVLRLSPAHRGAGTARDAVLIRAAGVGLGLAGLGLSGAGLWGLREVRAGLLRERISGPTRDGAATAVTSGAAARSLAEVIRERTAAAAGGRTYAEVDPYLAAEGATTAEADEALKDERTGAPVENPDHALWLDSTTLQTALMQAYMASRVAQLTLGLGAAFLLAGLGLAAAAGAPRR